MEASDVTTRLTEREKEALRLWLDHKSAKEIALELGISHHAVEKRLKMARTKLDAGSSLEAARILADAEGAPASYGQSVAGPPELPPTTRPPQSRQYRPIFVGGIAMSLAIILALSLTPAEPPATIAQTSDPEGTVTIDGNLEPVFDELDEDHSGYLENPESPFVTLAFINPDHPGDEPGAAVLGDGTDPTQIADFYKLADKDADGRISFREYYVWSRAELGAMGIDTSMVLKVLPETKS